MSDSYRTSDMKPDEPVQPAEPTPPTPPTVGVFGVLVVIAVFALLVNVWMNASRWSEEARVEAIAKPIRERVCGEQGPKNARAWATVMRLKDPAILCIWDGKYTQGCGGVVTCSIGTETAVYGILCKVGDGAEDEGKADRCWLTTGGGR